MNDNKKQKAREKYHGGGGKARAREYYQKFLEKRQK